MNKTADIRDIRKTFNDKGFKLDAGISAEGPWVDVAIYPEGDKGAGIAFSFMGIEQAYSLDAWRIELHRALLAKQGLIVNTWFPLGEYEEGTYAAACCDEDLAALSNLADACRGV